MIGGIVLAAGLSQRMDGPLPKQLLDLDGNPMVAVSVHNAEESALDRVVVVTGHRGEEVSDAVRGGRAVVVHNPAYRGGNMTSFRCGYSALPGCDAYVILLADMPGVTTSIVDRVVSYWEKKQPWAAVVAYNDRTAHPLLLSAAAMRQAADMDGAKGVWRFLNSAEPGLVAEIRISQPMPTDVNTIDDVEAL